MRVAQIHFRVSPLSPVSPHEPRKNCHLSPALSPTQSRGGEGDRDESCPSTGSWVQGKRAIGCREFLSRSSFLTGARVMTGLSRGSSQLTFGSHLMANRGTDAEAPEFDFKAFRSSVNRRTFLGRAAFGLGHYWRLAGLLLDPGFAEGRNCGQSDLWRGLDLSHAISHIRPSASFIFTWRAGHPIWRRLISNRS